MARPLEKIADITDRKELWKVAVKVHHKWTVVSNNKEHFELIFIDVYGTDIHVVVPTALKGTFDSVLAINNTYTVTNFLPQPNDLKFRTCQHKFIIKFTSATSVTDINKHEIPGKKLAFKPFADIISGKWERDLLIDVIGLVDEIGYTQNNVGSKKQQVNLILKDLRNNTLNYTLWESYAVKFINHLQQKKQPSPTIMLLQYAKVKEEGKYPLSVSNTYDITNLLINEDVYDIVEFRKRLPKDYNKQTSSQVISSHSNMWSQSSSSSQITPFARFMTHATTLRLSDIIKLPDLTWCVTVGTTKKLKASANGWYYQACHKCPKVAKGSSPPYICADGHSTEIEIFRYKLEIEVVDNGSAAIFVFWDCECAKLLEISAANLRLTMIEVC